ncbi:Cmx/CmrA family chloramphenicol efflux MFS transporter [Streptomyces sp. SID1328]|uniref:Cmx/CmrA family chloramphenicol efflux MFS transporter n=1 Tax=Streptomyces sp. SID1328 TaxID=2690250 RepID=UPI00136F3B65|nr:Cmx/CmrA family chloramphenicol efflux MFS transporter [Streptomyces sp. SID1328]MYV40974.1 Cmx/CmrA family chloramphenicol efflux MFS transporter [Streptomyces sp. SID1328]
MPFVVYVLGLATFAQGTSEYMLSGLTPDIARDIGVSIPMAGLLTSVFAVGMIVGAPFMAAVSIGWPRRRALLTFLSVFLLSHVMSALSENFWLLLSMRAVAAVANAGFLAVGLSAAAATVEDRLRGRATSVLLSGVTVACVIGVPAGAVLGGIWGWRSAFWAVSIISVPALIATLYSIPAEVKSAGQRPSVLGEARALKRPDVILVLLLAAIINAATFCTFTYVSPLVVHVTQIPQDWVPAVLALFGAGSFLGSNIGGRLADARHRRVIEYGGAALFLGWGALYFAAADTAAVLVLLFVLGILWFAVGSMLVARALEVAWEAPRLGGGFSTAAFNVGAAIGPLAGGLGIDRGLGYRSPAWESSLLMALAFVIMGLFRMRGVTPLGPPTARSAEARSAHCPHPSRNTSL